MSNPEHTKKDEHGKKRSLFERLIVGNSAPKLRKKKVIRKMISKNQETPLTKEYPNSLTVAELRDVLAIERDMPALPVVKKPEHSILESTPQLRSSEPDVRVEKVAERMVKKLTVSFAEETPEADPKPEKISIPSLNISYERREPVPFDEDALFVPLRSVKEQEKKIEKSGLHATVQGSLPETEYFYLDNGKALTSLEDFLFYVESLSNTEWKELVYNRKSNFVLWIEMVFGSSKLARLLELADSQKEAVLYIRSFLDK